MSILFDVLLMIFVILIILIPILERLTGVPKFFYKWIIRDFKISLFTNLSDDKSRNEQLYVVTGITWFNIPVIYQSATVDLDDDYGFGNFTIGKKHWIKEGKRGFELYQDAKDSLIDVRNKYIFKKKKDIWVSNFLNENDL